MTEPNYLRRCDRCRKVFQPRKPVHKICPRCAEASPLPPRLRAVGTALEYDEQQGADRKLRPTGTDRA